jgi:uncharacterized protein
MGLPIIQERDTKASVFVVLKVTEACNMGCLYCSAEKDLTKVPLLTGAIGKKVVDALVDLGLTSYSLCFHGGEPLLAFEAVQETVEYAQTHYSDTQFRFSLQSNLVLMKEATARWCVERDVSVGFSIDGEPQTNNRLRVFHDGRGSTEATLAGLRILQQYQRRVGCVAVIGPHNWGATRTFLPFLVSNGVTRLALNRLAPVGKGIHCKEQHDITDEQYTQCLMDCYLEMVGSQFRFQVKPIVDWARKIISPGSHSHGCYQCGAGWSHISVDPLGNVYACDRFTFDPKWVSGNLLDTSLVDIMNESKMVACRTRLGRIEACRMCNVVDVCGGSCAVTSYYEKGTIDAPGHECGNMQRFIPWLRDRLRTRPLERVAFETMVLGYDPEETFPLISGSLAS